MFTQTNNQTNNQNNTQEVDFTYQNQDFKIAVNSKEVEHTNQYQLYIVCSTNSLTLCHFMMKWETIVHGNQQYTNKIWNILMNLPNFDGKWYETNIDLIENNKITIVSKNPFNKENIEILFEKTEEEKTEKTEKVQEEEKTEEEKKSKYHRGDAEYLIHKFKKYSGPNFSGPNFSEPNADIKRFIYSWCECYNLENEDKKIILKYNTKLDIDFEINFRNGQHKDEKYMDDMFRLLKMCQNYNKY